MSRSIDLFPEYFAELRTRGRLFRGRDLSGCDLTECIRAGVRAEERMVARVGANAHRGYIFLSGLALLAAAPRVPASVEEYRARIGAIATRVLAAGRAPAVPTHGASLRQRHGLTGIHGEALAGLPSVFEHARPALRRALDAGLQRPLASCCAMSALMQRLEDTTAVHRCGIAGLTRLREDGRRIEDTIEAGRDPRELLSNLNTEYRQMRLTMGGVADCLALTLALEGSGVVLPDRETS